MALEWDIEVGQTVRRREEIHGGKGFTMRYGGAWYGGIEPSGQTPNVLIFSEPEAGSLYGYNFDGWTPDGVLQYTGEGKNGDQRLVAGNRAVFNHREAHRALRVFRARPPFATYLGEFAVDDERPMLWTDAPDEQKLLRQVIVFRLRPISDFIRGDLPEAPPVPADPVVDISAEGPTPTSADIPPEQSAAGSYFVEPNDEPIEYQRREAALVDRYKRWLNGLGHGYGRKLITVPDDAGRLYTDLHDLELNELIEAKASASRVRVRAGLGQLLDYARFVEHAQKSLLLPSMPRPDLLDLLRQHGCGCIWETASGRFERAAP